MRAKISQIMTSSPLHPSLTHVNLVRAACGPQIPDTTYHTCGSNTHALRQPLLPRYILPLRGQPPPKNSVVYEPPGKQHMHAASVYFIKQIQYRKLLVIHDMHACSSNLPSTTQSRQGRLRDQGSCIRHRLKDMQCLVVPVINNVTTWAESKPRYGRQGRLQWLQ